MNTCINCQNLTFNDNLSELNCRAGKIIKNAGSCFIEITKNKIIRNCEDFTTFTNT